VVAEEKIYIHQTPIITKDQIFTHLLWNGICSSQYSRLFLIATSNCNVTDNVAPLEEEIHGEGIICMNYFFNDHFHFVEDIYLPMMVIVYKET
jgi:hypothetical protein